jgi:hypothetical protein
MRRIRNGSRRIVVLRWTAVVPVFIGRRRDCTTEADERSFRWIALAMSGDTLPAEWIPDRTSA